MTDYASKSSKKMLKDGGGKAYQRDDREDRTLDYRLLRREFGKSKTGRFRDTPYTSDVDQVEYIFHKNEIHIVAMLELTRYDMDEGSLPPPSWVRYRSSLLTRYFNRDAQGKFCLKMSSLVGCPVWIVLFRKDLEAFWIFDITKNNSTWERKTQKEYSDWLSELKTNKLNELKEQENEQ